VTSPQFDATYALDDRYAKESGRIHISGVQALVRLPLMQRQRDAAAGLDTAGFISGYRGSPLGTYDMALWQAKDFLDENHVRFEPGINEDLAATAVWGSQQANLLEGPRYDGVFAIWYGKGPGVDRSCDALKHGNYAGSAANGGVLVLAGDDPGAKSSSIAHQSEQALAHCGIPVLNPANVQDTLDFGLYGWGLSRYSGCWAGLKCLTDTVDSSASVSVGSERVQIVRPTDFEPEGGVLGLHIGFANLPLAVEQRLFEQRLTAAQAFVRANGIDRVVFPDSPRRLGIVTTGKAYLDVRQALDELGISEARAAELGLSLYKVGMSWPLEPVRARDFAEGLEEVLVVEEKRPVIEEQLASLLYNAERRPRLFGKRDSRGAPLVPSIGELSPGLVREALRSWLEHAAPERASQLAPAPQGGSATGEASLARLPSFCSGCPHNTSTVVPDGSVALGGIGCHGMAAWIPERRTLAVTQMGGEGANWIGQAPFTKTPHIFQNVGDGTYFHSGLLAIRAAVTADVNITYKVLVNGAVAMTGGQPVEGESIEGEVTTPEVAHQLRAEGIERIAVLSDHPEKYAKGVFPAGVTVGHRDQLDAVQCELREIPGVTAIVYDQTCAAEARRLRKRGQFDDPDRRIVINEAVCENCGDCSVQSNCISIEPIETQFGRKRTINQSSCNKDFSCVKGHCPSFVSVHGGTLRKAAAGEGPGVGDEELAQRLAALPAPPDCDDERPVNILVTGIGGTGVVTIGALLGMAAHLEGKGSSGLDVTGLAQKNGAVTSHVRIARDPESIHSTRIATAGADLVLGCDIVVATGADALSKMMAGRTTVVANTHVAPTADFARSPDLDLSSTGMEAVIRSAAGDDGVHFLAATQLATALLGDSIGANLFLVGYAHQAGCIPLGLASIERAIELNGRAVEMNKRALSWGRLAAHDLPALRELARPRMRVDADENRDANEDLATHRASQLVAYQGRRLAKRYTRRVAQAAEAEQAIRPDSTALRDAVARYYYKLLAYKDEFEVARLYTDGSFLQQLEREFEGDYRLTIHLAPPTLPVVDPLLKLASRGLGKLGQRLDRHDARTGRAKKMNLGPWALSFMRFLARGKFLRGTPLNPFGYTQHRKLERQLIRDYEKTLDSLLAGLNADNLDTAVEIASLPDMVRGYEEVKERTLEDARAKQQDLLASFELRES
jgi:indolepyruvate ferredoxin oxidoreductase